jgi:hypothetical protein
VSTIRNRPTPEGAQLGFHLARFCDEAEPKARLRFPELPPRCNSCAFRAGPHSANGSPQTQMDVLKCLMEGREFYCHEPSRKGMLSLILWSARKIQAIKGEIAEAQEQLAIAVQNKWNRAAWQTQIRKHERRMAFYKKVKGALEAGYYIVPPFPVEIFAIRTDRKRPEPMRSDFSSNHDQLAQSLPIGEGSYVDPRPTCQKDSWTKTNPDGTKKQMTEYYATEFRAVDFPFKLAKPEIMGATAKAMAQKIFDRLGILPGTHKPDPIICGQIIIPNQPSWSKRDPNVINFFVAWWLDTSTLPK